MRDRTTAPFVRATAWLLVLTQVFLSTPVSAASADEKPRTKAVAPAPAPTASPKVKVNRTVPQVTPPPQTPRFSEQPSDDEIFRARVFDEPLVPMGPATTAAENRALAVALENYLARTKNHELGEFEAFLQAHASSAWRPSLLLGMGIVYRRTGYLTRALVAWKDAWELSRGETEPKARAVADRTLAELATLYSRLGRVDELKAVLGQAEGRDVHGSANETLALARQGLWGMEKQPERGFRCGPVAVERLVALSRKDYRGDPRITSYPSTSRGTSLGELRKLAESVGLKVTVGKRVGDAAIVLPALIHWKAGHYGALVREEGGRYLIQDPILGEDIWITRAALNEETTGYSLIVDSSLPKGWEKVGDNEASGVWGKGGGPPPVNVAAPGANYTQKCDCGKGMPVYSFQTLDSDLNIRDIPVSYTPPLGPAVMFQMTYNHLEINQPQIFTYSNLGPRWTFDWLSYIRDDPTNPAADVNLYVRGAGILTSTGYNASSQSYAPEFRSGAIVVRTSSSPVQYQRRMPDGSVETFGQPNGAMTYPRTVFLTSWSDPQGNTVSLTYDASLRIVAVTDAIGQVTTVSYESSVDPLKITKVTDPFGRSAILEYDATGALVAITDTIGLRSTFAYGGADFISAMTTPYGTTHFEQGGQPGTGFGSWIQATDPLGGTERLEDWGGYVPAGSTLPASEAVVPAGFSSYNNSLNAYNSYYWDKRAMALYPGDYSKARITHWLLTGNVIDDVKHSEKAPLENRVWYAYAGQAPNRTGTSFKPSKVARVLDDGTSQVYSTEYNAIGNVSRTSDPLGRTTVYNYDPTGMDLLSVQQINGESLDTLESNTYNSQHQMLTSTDASGQSTTYTYNAQGQMASATTPLRAGVIENQITTYIYDANGNLQLATGPATGATTSNTYDEYGRVLTSTDGTGYTLTYGYDAADRATKVTYPDGTYTQTVYNRLDPQDVRDRLGRWSHTFYDSLRRPVSLTDASGRMATQQWCACGSLDSVTDANGNTTSWQRDLQGRPTQETRADGSTWVTTYENTTSRVHQRTDAKGQVTIYTYALDDNLLQKSYTNAAVPTPAVHFTYDPSYNRVSSMNDGTGTTTYSYYPITSPPNLGAGRLLSVSGPLTNSTVSYSYDELGRVTTHGLSTFSTTTSYDVMGRVSSLGSPVGATPFAWTYVDTSGRPQATTYPNGQTTTYSYFGNTGDQRLKQIKHQQSSGGSVLAQFDYAYDAAGNISTWQQQLGTNPAIVYALGYDRASQLTSAVQKNAATQQILTNYGYAYDLAGNRTVTAQDQVATTSQYNNRNQLTQQFGGGVLPVAGLVGDQAAVTVTVNNTPASVSGSNQFVGTAQVGAGPQTFTVVATNANGNTRTNTYQVNVTGTTQSFAYDANGNLCATGSTSCIAGATTYQWDAENRLVGVQQGPTTLATFAYDGMGNRIQKTAGGVTHSYIYDGKSILEERLSSGQTYDYVQGPGIDQPLALRDQSGAVSYYLTDHLGSVVEITSNIGTVTLTRQYDPWGNLLQGSTAEGYAYTGREWDPEVGLYYYRARYYDPGIGRFVSEDPLGFDAGFNLYGYANANPVGATDPLGLKVDMNYFVKGRDVQHGVDAWEVAENIERARIPSISINDKDAFVVAAHGNAVRVRDDKFQLLDAKQLAKRIIQKAGKAPCCVKLLACYTGERTFAQELATELQTDVIAPDAYIQWMKSSTVADTYYYVNLSVEGYKPAVLRMFKGK